MADLSPLIRVRKHVVDQKQKFLAELYRQAEEFENQKKTLEDQMAEEQEQLNEMGVEMLSYFASYAKAVKERIADIEEAATKLAVRIEVAREDMRMAFAELKKIEITKETREKAKLKELNKKESNELDEIGIEIYRRKKSDSS
ncbi:MAG: flagellar FliJ family protein [Alphaproteobacteria bacterium]|nr:flagellar FliJ family protein [Alphaproteobacteria bacterium]